MFFKDRALQVKMIRTTDAPDDTIDELVERLTMDPKEINDLLKDQIQNLGVVIVGVAAGITALATAREVIVNNTNPANKPRR
jgi:hypothetical protein